MVDIKIKNCDLDTSHLILVDELESILNAHFDTFKGGNKYQTKQ